MAGVSLKVEPNIIKAQSSEIKKEIDNIEKQWKNIQEIVKRTKSYWEGTASTNNQKHYKSLESDLNRSIKKMKIRPTELLEIAQIYVDVETKLQVASSQLPTDIIK